MEDSKIILNYLEKNYPNDHVAIYLYSCGNVRSPITAINKIMNNDKAVFCAPFTEGYFMTIVKMFLEGKKQQYLRGEIKITPIY